MKDLRVSEIVKEIKLEGVWGRVRSKPMFSETIIHTLFEINSNSNYWQSLISNFQEFLASINKISILVGRLGAMLSFYEVYTRLCDVYK